MKRIILIPLFLSFIFFRSAAFASAVLVDAKGAVEVKIGDKAVEPKVGLELPDGSSIKTKKGAKAQVMFLDGTIRTLVANESLIVGKLEKSGAQTTVIEGIQLALNEASQSGEGPTVHGMVKMGPPATGKPKIILGSSSFGIEGLYPIHTTILMPKQDLVFMWSDTTKIDWTNPVLVVKNAEKKQMGIFSVPKGAKQLVVPLSQLKLKSGETYSWHLGYKQKGIMIVKGSHYPFTILGKKGEASLQKDIETIKTLEFSPKAETLMLGQVYYKYGLYHHTTEILVPLSQAGDVGGAVKQILFVSYLRMGLSSEMEKYR
ncbi:MAG: hypothetical protein A3I05_00335 [Deltaproteobacteria bacterium RIFCSPLOWO2_02_FULL_44_10]|nr:MAG: hypothetical protein A3C46_01200 [Deltaproteobacteria bacterium RIFCSPHIGHO2_02_FULL_44_16]OGQ47253.1 MAG: hypothetical protein A3I05_00335 [Deltaproteobacteria bacterium RIFCSPLOWO2_02_FULL_44_10]